MNGELDGHDTTPNLAVEEVRLYTGLKMVINQL